MTFDDEAFDATLLVAVADGNLDAFTRLYERHAPAILRYSRNLSGTTAGAEELLQETFLTFWSKRRSIRVVDESVLPWLLVVCRNHANNARRREAKHRTVPLLDTDHVDIDAQPSGQLEDLGHELAQLRATDRQLVELCLVAGLSYAEAARLLDLSTNAVGKRLQKARARLRKAALDYGD
jgi:RNA polymerase sigma factor (sigma-70 family)